MMNWALQLNNSQLENSFNSLLEKHHVLSFPNQPNPIPKPICDRSGQPEDTQSVFVVKGETSRSHEIDEKSFHEKLCASDRSGQPEITLSVIEARNLSLRAPLWEETRGTTSISSRTRSRRNARRRISWVFTTGSFATRNSARICLTSVL